MTNPKDINAKEFIEKLITEDSDNYKEKKDNLVTMRQMTDKEIFDIQKLADIYDVLEDDRYGEITPELSEKYEMKYYYIYNDVKTIEEFAQSMAKNDMFEN